MDQVFAPPLAVRHMRLIIATMLISTFMAAVEVTVISTAMPTIVGELGGFQFFSWVFGIYLLTQAVMTPLYGHMADVFGRKSVFLAGTALFLVGSLLCGLAHSMVALICFRALQGIGGGSLAPLSTTILGDIASPEDRPKVMGYVSGVWGFAAIIGPMLGAFFVHTIGWQFCFWINLPVGLATMLLVWRFLGEDRTTRLHASIDAPSAALLMAGLALFMVALVEFGELKAPALAGLLLAACVLLGLFVARERSISHPLLPMELTLRPALLVSNVSALLAGTLLIATTAFLPPLVQGVMNGSALDAGFVVGTITVSWTIASMTLGRAIGRISDRALAVGGGLVLLAGMAALVPIADGRSLFLLAAIGLPIGAGLGLTSIVFTILVQGSVSAQERGRAMALFFFSRLMGQAIGAAAFGGMLNAGLGDTHGQDIMRELMDPRLRLGLAPAELAAAAERLAGALHGVFLLAAIIAIGVLAAAAGTPRRRHLG